MQQTNGKGIEPSMDEILASIRKIIAEEPPAPKLAASRPTVSPTLASPPAPPPQQARSAPKPAPVVPPMPSALGTPARLSDMVREFAPAAISVSSPAPVPPAYHDDISDLVEGDARADTIPDAPSAGVGTSTSQHGDYRAEPSGATASAAAPDFAGKELVASDIAVTEPPAGDRDESDFFTRVTGFGAVVPPAIEPIRMARSQPLNGGSDFRMPEFSRIMPAPPAPTRPQAVSVQAAPAPPAFDRQPPEASPTVLAGDAVDVATSAEEALGKLAVGLAAPTVTSMYSPSNGALVTHNGSVETTMAVPVRRSLDDSIVDMLRPMVREWLDAHLPEMVEKALRAELAAGQKRDH